MSSITRVAVAVQVIHAPASLARSTSYLPVLPILVGGAVLVVRCTCSLVWLTVAGVCGVVGGLFSILGPVLGHCAATAYRMSGCGGCHGD